ncbi:MAG: energy-coupled thiamine transporter ThiT, partial [Clostridia bacterium]|nr:energy-coupled thiamine transporter ThiT [Clostridia bacterium]
MKNHTVRRLVESALMIAVATVLSLIKIDLPFGGGVTIVSMLPLILISHRYGWKWGLATAFVYSVAQLVLGLDNVAYAEN